MNRRLAIAWSVLTAGLSAQEAPRSGGAGQVVDSNGKGVASAVVRFVHRPIPWCASYGEADVVQANADASGRFRVDLLSRRPYSAYATWEVEGQPKVTAVAEHCIAGAFVTLREQQAEIVRRSVRVDGVEAWAAAGPLGFRVMPRLPERSAVPLVRREDGTVELPSLPSTGALFEVATGNGNLLWASWVSFGSGAAEQVLTIPAPVEVPVEVVDAAAGKPIAGAVVQHRSGWLNYWPKPYLDAADHSGEAWREVGRTDEHGRATLLVPAGWSPWDGEGGKTAHNSLLALAIHADGFASQLAGWNQGRPFFDQVTQAENPKPFRIPMQRPQPVTGRLTIDGKRAAAGVDVLLFMDARCEMTGGAYSSWPAPVQVAKTDQEGRFRFAAAPLGRSKLLIGVPLWQPPLAELCRDHRAPMPLLAVPFAVPGTMNGIGTEPLRRDLGHESLGFERVLRLQAVGAAGNPAQGVEICLTPTACSFGALAQRVTTDSAGRCEVLLPAGEWLLWSAARESGYLLQRLTSPKEQGVAELVLTMKSYRYATGRVSAEGKGVANVLLRQTGSRSTQENDNVDYLLENAASSVNQWLLTRRSDAQGNFRLPYIPMLRTTLTIEVYSQDGGTTRRAQFPLPNDAEEDPPPIEVELGR